MPNRVTITAEPIDALRFRFIASEPLGPPEARTYQSPEEAGADPVAQAALAIPGLAEVVVSGAVLTAVRTASAPDWDYLAPRIHYALEAATSSTGPEATSPPSGASAPGDDDGIYTLVEEIFQREINPAVAQHGGQVELIDVQDRTVVVRMQGGCQGCGMANVTLKQGIEASLRRAVPTVVGVRDITDHAAGTDPYFSSTSK